MRIKSRMVFALLLCAVCVGAVRSAPARSVEEKLKAATDYVPQASAAVDQLVEVARRFKIPMAIEWLEREGEITPIEKAPARKRSVKELIEEIVSVSPDHRVEIEGALVRVYSPVAAVHPFNFLNIRLERYHVKDGDLFAAEDQLRWAIRFTLEPEKYVNGYGGGYGRGSNDVFEFPKITLAGSDLTIREALNRIALAQGNALWVVTIKSADLAADGPWWKTTAEDRGHVPVTAGWRFLPLSDIAELAKEQVDVDVTIEGFLDQRMSTIPVILERGLTADSGGASGGSSSEGFSYRYSASIEKVGKDLITLEVHLTVGRPGELERKFDEKLKVTRGKVTELIPEPRIRVRGYFEARSETAGEAGGRP